ncbi:MAG: serine/threonine protein kinase [Gemmatimonadetes bacterium]|nr:serine/threonine protein kinase [Gemmatimonadota bacterium]
MTDIRASLEQALTDRYRFERELGSGGMAIVYLAEDLKHRRRVAVKVLRPELAATLGPDRFLREIEIAAGLQHPHILPLYDSGQASGFLYYVMPYVEGESLRTRLTRESELPIPEAVRIVREIVDALAYAHAQGIVHRDIKPENVLLSGRHAMVMDFGVAKAVSEATGRQTLTTAGVALGTPVYMAPEQAAADPHVDHRADIYAVGVVTYELLAGRPPFTGPTAQAILAAHVTEPVEPVTKHRAQVPEPLTQLVMRCLEKKAADRPQKADELLPILETLTTPSGGITPTSTQPVSVARPARRTRWSVAAAALVVLAGAGGYFAWRVGGATDPGNRLVLVPPFENRTGDATLNELGETAASWLRDAIVQDGSADAVASTVVQDLMHNELRNSTKPAEDLARRTGARFALIGDYRRRGDQVEFRGTLAAMPGAGTLATLDPVTGTVSDTKVFTALELRALEVVRAQFEQGGTDPRAYSRPSSLEAFREFTRAEEFFVRSEYGRAIEHASRAVALDTGWTQPLSLWSSALYNLGRRAEADSVLQIAEKHRNTLAPGELDLVDWLRAWWIGDLASEYRAARRMTERAPRRWSYALAVTALRTNRPREVLSAARWRDTSTAFGREWFSWYSVQASALHLLSEYRKELDVALEARRRDPLALNRLNLELRARAAMEQTEDVAQLLEEAATKLNGTSAAGLAYQELLAHGHDDAARRLLPKVLELYEGSATQSRASREDSMGYATVLFWTGDLARSKDWWQRLAAARDADGVAHRYLVHISAREGDRERALRESEQWAFNPPPFYPGRVSYRQAEVAASMGDKSRAVELLRRAFAEGFPLGIGIHRDMLLRPIWNEPGFKELIRPKG